MKIYVLVTSHVPSGRVLPQMRRQDFLTYEEANEAARATSPDLDPTLVPSINVADRDVDGYDQGYFWLGNRYAYITIEQTERVGR